MARVNVIYHYFPHYRAPVLRAMAAHGQHDYQFWGDVTDHEGIPAFKGDAAVVIHPLKFRLDPSTGRMKIGAFWPAIMDRDAAALIVIGNPNIAATWLMALVGRALGKKVLFWTHGWLRPEGRLKAAARNLYFSLANRVLTYGERAVTLAKRSGFPVQAIRVIYNSLDHDRQTAEIERLKTVDMTELSRKHQIPRDGPVLLCTARLTPLCRFDLLLEASALLRDKFPGLFVVLVGDGPERSNLEALAARHGLQVKFTGAIYDESELAELFALSDLTVSPGKVGLTAIHSLAYGVPVITHGNLDRQMPEVEAITPGLTGDFFIEGDARDLAATIERWLSCEDIRARARTACPKVIDQKFNPRTQTRLIDAAVSELLQ